MRIWNCALRFHESLKRQFCCITVEESFYAQGHPKELPGIYVELSSDV